MPHEFAHGKMSQPAVAIDFGASNTDVVWRDHTTTHRWKLRNRGKPPDEARVRTLLALGDTVPSDFSSIAVTGGNRELLPAFIDDRPVHRIDEVHAIGRGGLELAGVDRAIVTSAGSGTAVIAAGPDGAKHVTGSGVGGGTLVGLGRMLLDIADPRELDALARVGHHKELNLTIGEILGGAIGSLPPDTTAVNFGRVARGPIDARPADVAAALVNMVGQVIAVIAINAARATQNTEIVIVGHLTDLPSVRDVLETVGRFYSAPLRIPEHGGYATALGALLEAEKLSR